MDAEDAEDPVDLVDLADVVDAVCVVGMVDAVDAGAVEVADTDADGVGVADVVKRSPGKHSCLWSHSIRKYQLFLMEMGVKLSLRRII